VEGDGREALGASIGRFDEGLSAFTGLYRRLSDVASALGTTKQYVGKLAKDLESKRLVTLVADPLDGRAVLARPTERGRAFLQDACEIRAALEASYLGRLTASALLITVNWLAYVWGVGHGHVVEASLGYFINPLANVLLGVVVLRERLNIAQWTAVAIAAGAVLYIAVATGATPWISLTLAVSFSTYGLLRKVVHVEALQGLAVETLVLAPLAVGYLVWCEVNGSGAFGHSSALINVLLVGCGPMTAVPLFLFAFAARLIPYSTLGLLLYIAPSLQLLCGIFLYHEPFAGARANGFILIWLALLIYAADGVWRARKVAA